MGKATHSLVIGATVEAAFPFSITRPIDFECEHLFVTGAVDSTAEQVATALQPSDWEDPGDGTLVINWITGLQDSRTYDLTFLAVGPTS